MNRIRKGDTVVIISGRDRGRRGTVLRTPDDQHVVVEGVNIIKKHVKPDPRGDSKVASWSRKRHWTHPMSCCGIR